ncbi:Purple acid phosphatase 7 [Capsicum baccatum]|uniref:Purple acid phosphatase 7 n=1 Tax=Capsicum baccatum TaxID=33114 RepID=A0A2G2W4Q2_CAPBA|nr:Purple acid phosphatase 7 [Capsicum baccatum]
MGELQRLKHPGNTDGPLSILVVGDWGRRGTYNQSHVAHQMGIIGEELNIDFVVSTGDNFYDNGLIGVDDPAFEESFTNVYNAPSLQKTWYNDVAEFFFVDTTPFQDMYFTTPKDHTYDWRDILPRQDYLFEVLKDLDSALRESNAKWKIVVGHHTIKSAGHHGNSVELELQLLPILQANNVDFYLNGHDHCLEHISSADRKMTTDSQVHDAGMTMAAPSIATTSCTNAPQAMAPAEKPRKFTGIDFKRWQQKIFFCLTTLCLQRFTFEKAPEVPEKTSEQEQFVIVEAWKCSDFLCRNYMLSCLQDDLYDVYSGTKTTKELWGTLEWKYKIEDAGTKTFFVARFLEYKMIDNKSAISQVQELQVIIHDLLAEDMILTIPLLNKKLPPMWKDFKNYLKYKRKEMSVEDLIIRLRFKEDNKATERKSRGNSTMNGANIVEDDQNNSKKRKKAGNESNQSKKKFKGKCFNCGKIDHKSIDFRAPKKCKKKDQANVVESKKETDDLCAMLSECNLMKNPREWWMDFGATRHVFSNKELFATFSPAQGE